jgi:hypothetical protein
MSKFAGSPAARFFVLICAVLTYCAAVIVYFTGEPGFVAGVYWLGGVGTFFLALALFGSNNACDAVAWLLTFGSLGS